MISEARTIKNLHYSNDQQHVWKSIWRKMCKHLTVAVLARKAPELSWARLFTGVVLLNFLMAMPWGDISGANLFERRHSNHQALCLAHTHKSTQDLKTPLVLLTINLPQRERSRGLSLSTSQPLPVEHTWSCVSSCKSKGATGARYAFNKCWTISYTYIWFCSGHPINSRGCVTSSRSNYMIVLGFDLTFDFMCWYSWL